MRRFVQALKERWHQECLNRDLAKAVGDGDVEAVLSLLDRGADINADGVAFPPLLEAVAAGNVEMVRALLDLGATPNAKDPEHEITALMQAAQNGDVEIVRLLLGAGCDVNAREWENRTALTYATMFPGQGTAAIVRLLTEAGAEC
jgi:hypothetical protein